MCVTSLSYYPSDVIAGVMPPDEYAQHVNNSVYTNYIAKVNIQTADYVSCVAGVMTSSEQQRRRRDVVEKMYLPFNATTRHYPEYDGYDDPATAWNSKFKISFFIHIFFRTKKV
jgi:trehalose/maltose hydrolase-like predicted phosphorylase